MSVLAPGRAPRNDGELIAEMNQRIRALENPKALRVGPWVINTDPITGALRAMRPGQSLIIDETGVTDAVLPQNIDLSGYVTGEKLDAALAELGGTAPPMDLQAIFTALYEQLTGLLEPPDALAALAQFFKLELGAPITSDRLPLIPLSHIRPVNPNLLVDGSFDDERTLLGFPDWDYDEADGHSRPGCAYTVADSTTHTIHSNAIECTPEDRFDFEASAKWTGLTVAAGQSNPIQIAVSSYRADDVLINGAPTVLVAVGGTGGTSGWAHGTLASNWAPPPLTAYIVLELTVAATATGGTVKYDDAVARKTGTLPQSYVTGLVTALEAVWNGITSGVNDFIELLDVFGNFTPGSGLGTLTDAVNRLKWLNPLSGLFDSSKLSNMAGLPQIPNGLNKVIDLGILVDGATNALSGASKTGSEIVGAALPQAKSTMENLFEMLTATTRKVQALETENTASAAGGRSFNINFGDYPDGAFPVGLFNPMTYSGAGTGFLVISGGKAMWNVGNSGYRKVVMRFPTPTLTSYQIVRGTMASPPEQGTNVRIWSCGRANADMSDLVFARGYCTGFLTYRGDIGVIRGGVEYIWASNVPLTWSLDLKIIMGVGNNPRRHMVLSGDTIVWDGLEPSNPAQQSVIDANHMYWGAISETNGGKGPGNIAGASVSDNAPPAVRGTTFRASKRSNTDMTLNSGDNMIPSNFFETVDHVSSDLIYRPGSQCEIEATKQGTYHVAFRIKHNAYAVGSGGHGIVYKSTAGGAFVPYARGQWGECPLNAGFGVNVTLENATTMSVLVPLNPGDRIRCGFYGSGNVGGTGDSTVLADGSQTWLAVVGLDTA